MKNQLNYNLQILVWVLGMGVVGWAMGSNVGTILHGIFNHDTGILFWRSVGFLAPSCWVAYIIWKNKPQQSGTMM